MPALLLTAGCVWLLNGLHSAPDNGPASRNLMDCILPEVDRRGADNMFLAYGKAIDDDNDDYMDDNYDTRMVLPANSHGLVFLHSLRIGQGHPVPRLRSGKALSGRSFRYLFGADFDEVGEDFFRSTRVRRSERPLRSNNRTRQTRRYVARDDAPLRLFHLRVRGIELQPRLRDDGSDIESEGGGDSHGGGVGGQDIDTQLTDLWLQLIQDVIQKVPNRRGSDLEGYCKLSAEEREAGGVSLFKNLCLANFFNDCQWRVAREDEWDDVFNHLFPLGDKPSSVQNYRQCTYYKKWQRIKGSTKDRVSLEMIRRALKSKFSTLLWFPGAQSNRIWPTRLYNSRFKKFVNFGEPAPWVLCRREPSWN